MNSVGLLFKFNHNSIFGIWTQNYKLSELKSHGAIIPVASAISNMPSLGLRK